MATSEPVSAPDVDGALEILQEARRECDGWTPDMAKDALRKLLVDVRTERRKRLEPITLSAWATEWIDELDRLGELERSTRLGYRYIIESHLLKSDLARRQLASIEGHIARYVRAKQEKEKVGPATTNRHLNLLHKLYVDARQERGYVRWNPGDDVKRRKEPRTQNRPLSKQEFWQVLGAFDELEQDEWTLTVRVMFVTLVWTGLRKGEALGLRWKDLQLGVPDEATLTVRETWVHGAPDTPKSEAGERTHILAEFVADELFQHRARSRYDGDDSRVFCHPKNGNVLNAQRYATILRAALAKAGVPDLKRPTHDLRVTKATHAWLAGASKAAMQGQLGHADFKTTERYINAAGELYAEDARLVEEWLGLKAQPKAQSA